MVGQVRSPSCSPCLLTVPDRCLPTLRPIPSVSAQPFLSIKLLLEHNCYLQLLSHGVASCEEDGLGGLDWSSWGLGPRG